MARRILVSGLLTTSLFLAACGSSHSSAPPTSTATSSLPVSAAPSITAAPILTVATTDGTVGYRSVGAGTPLVMITGFGASIDQWQPSFVDALALHYRVITLDNAGVGQTSALPAPLSATKLAAQTSAFITALHLGRPDVLGWSMGGMVAQALAVAHPDQVAKLVLCATLPGDGHVTQPSAAALKKLQDFSNPAVVLSLLFPADQQAALSAYVQGILSFPDSSTPKPAAVVAEEPVLLSWTSGSEPAGRQISKITAPTLVADGAEDQLGPLANAQHLAATIPGAQLVVYPDAGHAFLFQDQTAFVARLLGFLGQ